MQDAVLTTSTTILSVPNGCDDRDQFSLALRAHVDLNSVIELDSLGFPILGHNSLTGLTKARSSKKDHHQERFHVCIIPHPQQNARTISENIA
jgi:hypothetical protein